MGGTEVLRAVSGWVTDGVAVELPARLTSPDLQLSRGTMRQFDANFDVEKSRTGGQIEGVADDSEAFKAGLRNGQSLRRYSVMSGDGQGPPTAEVEVLTDGEVKTIRYTAIGPPMTVRQYVLRKGMRELAGSCGPPGICEPL